MSPVCRICLAGEVKMYLINNTELFQLFEKLVNTRIGIEDGRPKTICYICYAQLQRCQKFAATAQRSEEILHGLINKGIKVTHETLKELNHCLQDNYLKVVLQPPLIPMFSDDIYNDLPPKRESPKEEPANPVFVSVQGIKTEDESESREFSIKIEQISESDKEEETCGENSFNSHLNEPTDKETQQKHTNAQTSERSKFTRKNRVPRPKTIGCRICGRKFAKQDNLNKHFKTHPGMKPYLCDHCDDSFYHKKDLLIHKRSIHVGHLGHICKTCGKTFSHKGMYDRHMLTHFGIKPYRIE